MGNDIKLKNFEFETDKYKNKNTALPRMQANGNQAHGLIYLIFRSRSEN